MKIPAGAFNSAFKAGASEALNRIPARFSAVKEAAGWGGKATAVGSAVWGSTAGNISGGFRAIRSGDRGYGAGRMAAGIGASWVGMGAVNIVRPGDNFGLF